MDNEVGDYTRTRQIFPSVSHYYGDVVRQLFITTAALVVLGAPFYADTLSAEIPFEIVGAIVLVALAALANPHSRPLFFANAIAAGVGLLIYETWALTQYDASSWVQFVLREVIAVMFLVAFYFSVKTLRAFIFHQIGKHEGVGEFDDDA